jgi:mevalonate kinase
MALSIPFSRYRGRFEWANNASSKKESKISNDRIRRFFKYIVNIESSKILSFSLNIDQLEKDIDAGLYFKSNIPNGYGLGSSGALVAAMFDRYVIQTKLPDVSTPDGLLKLKKYFALLESYFHGQSSGLDPLISYLNKPLLVSGAEEIDTITLKWKPYKGPGAVFLIDSGAPGETQPLVNQFAEKYNEHSYRNMINHTFIPIVNNAIQSYVDTDNEKLIYYSRQISSFQASYFEGMIPDSINKVWQIGLDTNAYSLKLCGSGGGGMMLGFTHDMKAAEKHLLGFAPIIIHHI